MLGSLCRAMGAEGLRHLDDRGSLPPACPHHYHLSGNTGFAGWTLHSPQGVTGWLQATLSNNEACGMNEILFCLHGGRTWQPLFSNPWGTLAGVM